MTIFYFIDQLAETKNAVFKVDTPLITLAIIAPKLGAWLKDLAEYSGGDLPQCTLKFGEIEYTFNFVEEY